jgi:hypothetical protein
MPNLLGSDLQVYFLFDPSGSWPPVPSEGLRVEALSEGSFRVIEAPFFVRNVAVNDVVRAESDDGVLWAGDRLSWGGHQTLRVTPRKETPLVTCRQVLEQFGALGLVGEELEEYELVAFDVPPDVPVQPVKDLLVRGDADQLWWYEEACIGPSWPN